ncbi:MAG: hypothetical protein QM704_10160 [Anaeromyxobacteraceae bacterium]
MTAAALAVALLVSAQPRPPPAVAVLDIQLGQGITGIDRAALTDVAVSALTDREAWRLVTLRDVGTLLSFEKKRELLGCTEGECLAELAGALGTEAAVVTNVGRAGASAIVTGRIVKSSTGELLGQAAVEVEGMDLTGAVRKLGRRLLAAWRSVRGMAPPRELAADCATAAACKAACDEGSAEACARLAALSVQAAPDPAQLAATFAQACERGTPGACAEAGDRFLALGQLGRGVGLLEQACLSLETEAPAACARAAKALLDAAPPARDARRAGAMLRVACDGGLADACLSEARLLAAAPATATTDAQVRTTLASACDQGRAAGCSELARFAEAGRGGAKDPALAASLRAKACHLGEEDVCLASARDRLTAGDEAGAVPLLERLCGARRADSGAACGERARVAQRRSGRLSAVHVRWAKAACEAGGAAEACAVAVEGASREGLPDPGAAARWLRRACPDAGDACGAAAKAAVAAVPQGTGKGGEVLAAACDAGHGPACLRLSRAAASEGRGAEAAILRERACETATLEVDCERHGLSLGLSAEFMAADAQIVPSVAGAAKNGQAGGALTLIARGALLEAGLAGTVRSGGAYDFGAMAGLGFDAANGRLRLEALFEFGVVNAGGFVDTDKLQSGLPSATGLRFYRALRAGASFGSGAVRWGVWLALRAAPRKFAVLSTASPVTGVQTWEVTAGEYATAGLRFEYLF